MADLVIEIGGGDEEAIDEACRALRRDMRDIGVGTVDRPAGPVPDGAKSGMAVATGIVIPIVASVTPIALGVVMEWAKARRHRCTITIQRSNGAEIQVDDVDFDQVHEVISRLQLDV